MRKKLLITTQILVLLTSLIGIGTYANSSKDILLQEVPKFQQENKVAVIIGVNTYDRSTGLRPLKYAASDATNLKNTLIKQGYKVRLLTNHHAGKHMILNAIEQAGKTLKRNTGTFIFAYSGHGFASNKQNYLASHGTVINRLAQSALPLREVQQAIRRTGAKRAILFIDACRNDPNIAGSKSVASTGFIYSKSEGIKTLYATKFGEVSWESPQLRHGVFSHFLIKALRGEAADRNGVISFSSVEKYVQQNVSNWTFSHRMPNTQLPFSNGNSFGVLVLGSKGGFKTKPPASTSVSYQSNNTQNKAQKLRQQEQHYWQNSKKCNQAICYQNYLKRYPQGKYAGLARIQLQQTKKIKLNPVPALVHRPQTSPPLQNKVTPTVKYPNLKGVNFGRYYALLIGNSKYSNFANIPTAVNDIDAVASVLRSQYGFKTAVLKNASQKKMLSALNSFVKRLRPNDNLLIYYAGHSQLSGGGHWLPSNASKYNKKTWIGNNAFTNFIDAMKAKKVIVIADSIYTGTLAQSAIPRPILNSKKNRAWFDAVMTTKVRVVMSSGALTPIPDSSGKHSVFTNAFLTALRSGDSVMEGATLYLALRQQVKRNSRHKPLYAPIKFAGHQAGDFIFLRGGRIPGISLVPTLQRGNSY